MKRSDVEQVKQDMKRLADRINEMERCAGWHRYVSEVGRFSSDKQHPDDVFNYGQFTAAVKRARMDLSKSLVRLGR